MKAIHLVDPSPLVMKGHTSLLDSYITNPTFKITLHEKKGQEIVLGPESKIIFIAGMGGKEIRDILTHLESSLSPEDSLVISPHRDLLSLRDFLHRSSFRQLSEGLVFEDERFYQVLKLSPGKGEKVHPFGVRIFEGEVGRKYLSQQLQVFGAHRDVQSREYWEYLNGLTQRF